jgi:hypothetical protein
VIYAFEKKTAQGLRAALFSEGKTGRTTGACDGFDTLQLLLSFTGL